MADVSGPVVLVAADGTAVVTTGPPSTAFSVDPEDPSLTLLDGAWPGAGEIVLEQSAAETADLATGDETTVVLGGEPRPVTVSGVFGIEAAAAGAVLVGIDGDTAREVYAPDGLVPQIAVWADASGPVDEDALADRVASVLPSGAEAVMGEQARAEASEAVEEVLGFVETFLLVFAAIALFVGAFIIANTFAMSVRERLRELALLRALGASPGQVFASVLVQALVVGLVGGGFGVLAGAGLVRVIRWGLALAGFEFSGRSRSGPRRSWPPSRSGRSSASSRPCCPRGGPPRSRPCRRCATTSRPTAAPGCGRWAGWSSSRREPVCCGSRRTWGPPSWTRRPGGPGSTT